MEDAQKEEIRRLTEELEKLRTVHQKKSLDYDRLEQKYENIKQELHYTRVQSEKVHKNTDNNSSKNLNSSTEVKNTTNDSDSESEDDEDMDRLIAPKAPLADLDLIQPDFNNNNTTTTQSSPNNSTTSSNNNNNPSENTTTAKTNINSSSNPDNQVLASKNKELEQKVQNVRKI